MSREEEVVERIMSIPAFAGKASEHEDTVKSVKVDADGRVSAWLQLPHDWNGDEDTLKTSCEDAVASLAWVRAIKINLTRAPAPARPPLSAEAEGLSNVSNIIAVSSCKGGVGKSTVAVNLAYALSALGHRVGIFDADVYGPSLPTMVSPEKTELYMANDLIIPLEYETVKLMSFGYVPKNAGSGAAIMRGPMVTQVINQLLTGTAWGPLDYLVIDMPPGTGDVQLTLAQIIPLTAAVIVTTPQDLSFVDVVKGIQMFDKLKVPTIAAVENMSFFVCDGCDKKHYVFGQGALKKLIEQFGFKNAFSFPIEGDIASFGDDGKPYILAKSGSDSANRYRELGSAVVDEVLQLKTVGDQRPELTYEPGKGLLFRTAAGQTHVIQPAALRRKCRCAVCVEEMTGKQLLKDSDIPENIAPTAVEAMGNYAVAVAWNDGHTSSVYPYESILEMTAEMTV